MMIEIQEKSNCCGCHACFSKCPKNAIEMIEDAKGFKYPKIDKEKCINCGLCDKVCPILNNKIITNSPKAYACINMNEQIRMQSTSGGIFTLLAETIIKNNGVVFGASFNEEFLVTHEYAEKIEDLYKFRGSKYLQSSINDTYKKAKEFLDADRYVLFTGTPCQIEGLIKYLGKDYSKLYLQDIICHGVPSPKVWKKYIEYKEKQYDSSVNKMNFRDKSAEGWNKYHFKMDFKNNNSYNIIHGNDSYMKAFLSHLALRESCTSCKFKKENRLSDITLADFWGINNIKPEMNDEKGTSLVIVNSEKGKELFELIKENIKFEEVDFKEAIKYNPSMVRVSNKSENSDKFFDELDDNEFDEVVRMYLPKQSFIQRVKAKVKKVFKKVLNK